MDSLLAIEAGLRTGFALYGADGRLCWYRSHHYASIEIMKQGVAAILDTIADLKWLVVEGSGDIADFWIHEAKQRGIHVKTVSNGNWHEKILCLRERRSTAHAKKHADGIARQVIAWSALPRAASLLNVTADAILLGLWGVLETGTLAQMPAELHRA